MKNKYQSTDNRTGYKVGEIVELTLKELNATPFNVFMRRIGNEQEDVIEESQAEKDKAELESRLRELGLSPARVLKVLSEYDSIAALKKNLKNPGIDNQTDKFLKDNFGTKRRKNK